MSSQAIHIPDAKNLANLALVGVGLYAAFVLYRQMSSAAETIGEPIGKLLAKFEQFMNGNHDIEATQGGVALTDLGLDNPDPNVYIMSQAKREAWAAMHPDNATILDTILDSHNQVKPKYLGFINTQTITLGDL